jgi:flagellar export protein FliJ
MRDYRNQVLDTEKNLLMALNKRLQDIEERIRLCTAFRLAKQEEMQAKQQHGLPMRELEEYKFYEENTRHQLEDLEVERVRAAMEVERQRNVVLKASQDVASLDKLEEKQLDDYRFLEARDNEKTIQEHVITQLVYSKEGAV